MKAVPVDPDPLQHEPPKALQRAQEERLLKTWETPMGWRYDRQAPQAGAMRDVALYFQSLRPRRTVQTQDD
jgi:hypothetical protein